LSEDLRGAGVPFSRELLHDVEAEGIHGKNNVIF
jgi:hypothetical protein